jgi:hypothetical protein
MDEKTAELRDIFMSVSDEETVTETQAETHGSLSADGERVDDRLRELVETLCQSESLDTDLPTGTYVEVARAFYDDADDAEIADRADVATETAFRARLDLHLVRESDRDAPLDLDALRGRREADAETLATELGVDRETVVRYRRVVDAEDAARAANDRYRSQFDELLADADLSGRFLEGVREDGLDEAAEDIETDVSF